MCHSPQTSPQRPRRGFTLLEVIVTVIVFGIVLSIVANLTRRAIDQRRRLDVRRAALLEVSNALEILEADRSARPAPGESRELSLPEFLTSQLDSPRLIARATALDGAPGGVRLDVELTWMTEHGRRSAPLELSTILYPESMTGGVP